MAIMISIATLIWLFCIYQITCGFFGFIANSAVLASFSRKRKEKSVFTKTYVSLSAANIVSDTCSTASGCVLVSHLNVKKVPEDNIRFLVVMQYVNRFATCVSFFLMIFITIQTLTAASLPFQFKYIFTAKVVHIIIVSIWLAGVAIISSQHWKRDRHSDCLLHHPTRSPIYTFFVDFLSLVEQRRVTKQIHRQ